MTEFKDPVAVPHKYRNRFLRESGVGSVTVTSSSSGGSSTPSWSSISGKPSWITMDTPAVSTFTNDAGYIKSGESINADTLDNHDSSYFINTENIGSQSVSSANYANSAGSADTSGSCTGNAATATKLQVSAYLWGQEFDGTEDVSGDMRDIGNIYLNDGSGNTIYFDGGSECHISNDADNHIDIVAVDGIKLSNNTQIVGSLTLGNGTKTIKLEVNSDGNLVVNGTVIATGNLTAYGS